MGLICNIAIEDKTCFEVCGVQRFHLQEVCAGEGPCSSAGILPRMKISIVLFHIKNFHVMHVSYITFKKKTSTCGSYVGHIWIVLWISGSNGSTGVTHFQP